MDLAEIREQPAGSFTEENYYNLPDGIRAELINGVFYNMASPSRIHQEILGNLYASIHSHIRAHKGACRVYPAPFAVKLFADEKTIVEPDISVICDPDKLTDRGCTGAPDWVIEIASPSNPRHDYIRKLNLYSNAGVREYWIVDPRHKNILVYNLDPEQFQLDVYSFTDVVKAGIFEDFSIDFSEIMI